jgi:hypothetical protein
VRHVNVDGLELEGLGCSCDGGACSLKQMTDSGGGGVGRGSRNVCAGGWGPAVPAWQQKQRLTRLLPGQNRTAAV